MIQLSNDEVKMLCADCKTNTFGSTMQEYYMVTDVIWTRAKLGYKGYLCIGCLENRIGRQLVSKDFKRCRLNNLIKAGLCPASDRLKNRILAKS